MAAELPRTATLAHADGSHIVVDGVRFDPDWLRDNCRCDACRIVQTDERRFMPWSIQQRSQAELVTVVDGEVIVMWSDGHRSTFGAQDWESIERAMTRGRIATRHWRRGDDISRFDHDTVLNDEHTRCEMFAAFARDGAAIMTGSPTVPGSIITTAKQLGIALVDSSLGFIFDVELDPDGFNIAYTAEALPPHNDNAQYTHPPSGQILAFLANETTGGDSVLVDGWTVLDRLRATDPAAFDVLCRVDVGHRQYSTEADAYSRNPLVVRRNDGGYRHLRFSNQLRQPLPFDHPDLAEWYRAYRLLGNIITDPENALTFRMNAGDSLLVNGYRVLHARTAFIPNGRRHLQDVYFNVDDIFGSLARMSGEAVDSMKAAR
jgi:gamma-butyrobetaine dioxygenase